MAECILLKSNGGDSSDDCTATKAQVLTGYTAITKDSDDKSVQGTMKNNNNWTSRIGVNGRVVIPVGYHDGSGYVDQAISNRGAITTSLPINGSYTIPEGYHNGSGKVIQSIATMGAQTINPKNSAQTVSCNGKYMTGNVSVPAVSNLAAGNIKKGVNVGGVTGTFEGWVITPSDLYLRGNNVIGFYDRFRLSAVGGSGDVFSGTSIRFDAGQMTIKSSSSGIYSKEINLSGYVNSNIELDITAAANGYVSMSTATKSANGLITIGVTISRITVATQTRITNINHPIPPGFNYITRLAYDFFNFKKFTDTTAAIYRISIC